MTGTTAWDREATDRAWAYSAGKRVVDVLASGLGLAVCLPACVFISLAVRADSEGPALLTQDRLGRHGRRFRMFKFRTMRCGSARHVREDTCVVEGDSDPRLTRIGRWLRRWSVDELPQLLNVMAGDMSLIGPRPDLPEALALYTPRELRKLGVRPGLTGLAQVSGRNCLSAREKWELDVRYVESMGALQDLRIAARTLGAVAARGGVFGAGRREGGPG